MAFFLAIWLSVAIYDFWPFVAISIWPSGYMANWLPGLPWLAVWLSLWLSCYLWLSIWLPGFLAICGYIYLAIWLYGYLAFWPFGYFGWLSGFDHRGCLIKI